MRTRGKEQSMDNERRRRLFGDDSSIDSSKPLSVTGSQSYQRAVEFSRQHRLLCQLTKCLKKKIRDFLEEVGAERNGGLLETENLSGLLQDLILYARYQRFDAECYKRAAEQLRQSIQGLPQSITEMKRILAGMRHERGALLVDLRVMKKRRRNRRRRR